MIKAVILDLNGIFVRGPLLSHQLEVDFGLNPNEFVPVLREVMNKIRRPDAGPAWQYWQPHLYAWNINLSEKEFWRYWFKSEKVSTRMVTYVSFLREKGIKIFVLSNNFKERAEFYGHYDWLHKTAHKIYFSFETGLVKPDPRAWEHILEENHLKPSECIFFDDKTENLAAAEKLGIKSFRFVSERLLEDTINSFLEKK